MRGRFAPSPTGSLHLGNLRTAAVAWLAARSTGGSFVVRMEDLDRVNSSTEHEAGQLADLDALGIDWDGEVVRQSERFDRYVAAIERLDAAGLVYQCFCSRRMIREEIEAAPNAPHLPTHSYPGTCRELSPEERTVRLAGDGRAADRLRASSGVPAEDAEVVGVDDVVAGRYEAAVDDVVLRRNDGVPAYNLAVVVDDAEQDVTQVVRGDDLLSSTPRQMHLQRLLGLATPQYVHVPLVIGDDGQRLAKRHGAITLADLAERGVGPADVVGWIAETLGRPATGGTRPTRVPDLLTGFDVATLGGGSVAAPRWARAVGPRS